MEKNKKKRKNRALAQPHSPGGVAAQSENSIFLVTEVIAPPRPLNGAATPLARPRDPLRVHAVVFATFGRSYQATSRRCAPEMARPYASRVRVMALARPHPRPGYFRDEFCNHGAPARLKWRVHA
ncbi:hypothetical protein PIB30_112163, partial [Stylosanthes scabra]|nr:hypothetical protein [Stylosanthes scabra]